MPWYACIAIIAVVYGIGRIRSRSLQAFVYSMPIPITLVMLAIGTTVDSTQLIGVLGLVLFFVTVRVVHGLVPRLPLLGVVGGIAVYLGFSFAVRAFTPPAFLPTLIALAGAWAVTTAVLLARGLPNRHDPSRTHAESRRRKVTRETSRLGLLTIATFAMVWIAGLIGGLAVTFPYSGVLTAADLGYRIGLFTRHFAVNSLSLLGFFSAFYYTQGLHLFWLSLAAAWATFLIISGLVAGLKRLSLPARAAPRQSVHQ